MELQTIYLPKFNLYKFRELSLISAFNALMAYQIPITLNVSTVLRINIYFCRNINVSSVQLIIILRKVQLEKINA